MSDMSDIQTQLQKTRGPYTSSEASVGNEMVPFNL